MPGLTFEDQLLDEHVARAEADKPIGHFSLRGFDSLIGGIRLGRFTIIAGSPGVSKTTLIGQLADDAACHGFTAVVNTLELAPYQFVAKSVSRLSKIPFENGTMGDPSDPEVARAISCYRKAIAPSICLIDKPMSAVELSAAIGGLKQQRGQAVILFVDYLQIMPTPGNQSRIDERLAIKESVAGLRQLANSHDVPVFAISSVNRTTYEKATIGLDALGGSSAIEYSADSVLLLSVEGKGEERVENMTLPVRPLVLTALKNRYAPSGSSLIEFDTTRATFRDRESA
jgi:replicative DNA helicase